MENTMSDASQHINFAIITPSQIDVLSCRWADFDDYFDSDIFNAEDDWLEPLEWNELMDAGRSFKENGLDKMDRWGGDQISPLFLIDENNKESHWYLNEKLGLCKAAPPHREVSAEDMRSVLLRAQAKGWVGIIAWSSFCYH